MPVDAHYALCAHNDVESCSRCVLYMCSHVQEGSNEKSAKQEKDELIMALLLDEVLPKATTLYMAGPLQVQQQEHLRTAGWTSILAPVQRACMLPCALHT